MYCGKGEKFNKQVEKIKNDSSSGINDEIDFGVDLNAVQNAVNGLKDAADTILDFKSNFQKNQFGTLVTLGLDILINAFGDTPQSFANMIQTVSDGTVRDKNTVMYEYSDLQDDGAGKNSDKGAGNRDKYTKVGVCQLGQGEKWQKVIDIKKDNTDNLTFKTSTKIPVMSGDVYNIAVNHINFFDVNFFRKDSSTERYTNNKIVKVGDNKVLKSFKKFISSSIHVTLYVASAMLITMLIVYGVQIVRHSFDNPQANEEAKEGLNKFVESVVMLVSSVIIMAICLYGSEAIFSQIDEEDTYELPIRVNVEETGYSFSTTVTGYVRYMASIEDVDKYAEKAFYSFGYIFLALINLLAVVMMLVRMFGLWILSILGPIIATMNIFDKKIIMSYKTWVELYISLSIIQIVVTMGYKIVLNYLMY